MTLIHLATGLHPHDIPSLRGQPQFESLTNLSPKVTESLRWMTQPLVEDRPQSVEQLMNFRPRESTELVRSEPQGLAVPVEPNEVVVLTLVAFAIVTAVVVAALVLM